MGRVLLMTLVISYAMFIGSVAGFENNEGASLNDTITFSYCNGVQYDFGAVTPDPVQYNYAVQAGPGAIDELGFWTWYSANMDDVGTYQRIQVSICDPSVDTCRTYELTVLPTVGRPCSYPGCWGSTILLQYYLYSRDVNAYDCDGCRVPAEFHLEYDYNGDVMIDAEKGELQVIPGQSFIEYDVYFDLYMPLDTMACHWHGELSTRCCANPTGNINCDPYGAIDISDITALVNHLFVNFAHLCCHQEANTDGDEYYQVDISDLTRLVNTLFVTFEPTADCR